MNTSKSIHLAAYKTSDSEIAVETLNHAWSAYTNRVSAENFSKKLVLVKS